MGSIGIEIFDVKVLYSIYLMIYCIYQRNTVLFSEFKTELKCFRQFSNDSLLKKLKEEKMYFFFQKIGRNWTKSGNSFLSECIKLRNIAENIFRYIFKIEIHV